MPTLYVSRAGRLSTECDTAAWLSAPNDALSGESPLSLLDTDAGVRLVEEVLTRIEFGVYS